MLEPAIGRLNFARDLLRLAAGRLVRRAAVRSLRSRRSARRPRCFGVFGALIVVAHARRIPIWQSGLGPTLLINLVFTLTIADISIGGHLGGLVGGLHHGLVASSSSTSGAASKRSRSPAARWSAVISVVGAIAVAGGTGLTPNGFTL